MMGPGTIIESGRDGTELMGMEGWRGGREDEMGATGSRVGVAMLRIGSVGDKAGAPAESGGKGVGLEGEATVVGAGTASEMGAVAIERDTGAIGRMKGAGMKGDDGIGETEAAEVIPAGLIGDVDGAEVRDPEEVTEAGGEATGPKGRDMPTGATPAITGGFTGERV